MNSYIDIIQELLNIDEEKVFAYIGFLSQNSWDAFKVQNNYLNEFFSVDAISKVETRISDEILGKHLFERLDTLVCTILCIDPFDDGQTIRQLEDSFQEGKVQAIEYLSSILTIHLGVSIHISILASILIIRSLNPAKPELLGKVWRNRLKSSQNLIGSNSVGMTDSDDQLRELAKQLQIYKTLYQEAQIEAEKQSVIASIKVCENFLASNQELEALITAFQLGTKLKEFKYKKSDILIQVAVNLYKVFHGICEINRIENISARSVSFSPDGKTFISSHDDKSVKIWNKDATLLKTLEEDTDYVKDICFSPDGQLIALVSSNIVKLKQLNGNLIATLHHADPAKFRFAFEADVGAVCFSPSEQIIATAGSDKTVKLWNYDGTLVRTLEEHDSGVIDVHFSPNGQRIVSATIQDIKLWNSNGTLIKTLEGCNCVRFSPTGELIVGAHHNQWLNIWDCNGELVDGTWIESSGIHEGRVSSLEFSHDGRLLASLSWNNLIRLWNLEVLFPSSSERPRSWISSKLIRTINARKGKAFSRLSFSHDGKTLISSGEDISFWNIEGNQPITLTGEPYHFEFITDVGLSPDGQFIALGTDSPSIFLWKIDGTFLRTLEGDPGGIYSVSFSSDGKMIASGGVYLKLWSKSGALIRTFDKQDGYISSVSFNPDGKIIAAAGDNIIKLWSIGGTLLKTLEGHEDVGNYTYTIPRILFSPDGQLLASASFDGTVRLWDLDGVLVKTLKGHTGYVQDVSFSPDGKTIISASDDKTIKLWNLDGEELKTLGRHDGEVKQARFSPDGYFIVSIGNDGIKFWSPHGQEIATLEIYGSNINFTPDGKTLIVDKTLLNLDLDNLLYRSEEWLSDYSKHIGFELKDKEETKLDQSSELDPLSISLLEKNTDLPEVDESSDNPQILEPNLSNSSISVQSEMPEASIDTPELSNESVQQKYRVLNSVARVVSSSPSKQGNSIIATIGINKYQYWPQLTNAVNDAIGFQQVLVDKLGFAAPIDPLLEEQANKASIIALVEDYLREVLKEEDNLVLFFAGHGHTRVDKAGGKTIGETGFLVPVEARGPKEYWSDYIQIDQFLQLVSRLPARHILLVLDSCHSGFALGEAMKGFRSSIKYEQDLGSRISRKVITSARREQFALDGGPIPGHSLFTGTLIDGLNWGKADLDSNGLITSSELGLFIQQKVGQASEAAQTPDFGSFYIDDRGEMIISLRNQSLDALKARAFSALQQGKLEDFKERVEEVIALNSKSPEALYLEYRMLLFYPGSTNIERAIQLISQLSSLKVNSGIIPLSQNDLWQIDSSLRSRKSLLSLVETEFPLEIIFTSGSDPEHLENTEEETLGSVNGYKIPHDFLVQLQVKNPTQAIYYVYMVRIDSEGRLSLDNLWQNWEVLANGIKTGEVQQSHIFTHKGATGVYERRLFASSESLTNLLFPPPSNAIDPASHGIDPIESLDLANVKMKAIRYCVTQSYEFLPSGTLDEVD